MIEHFFVPELLRMNNLNTTFFQQDGATAHTARDTMATLRQLFTNRLISRFGDVLWLARSPDLTAPDYFLWGYLKEKVYSRRLHTIPDLKMAIQEEIRAIPNDMIQRVMTNFRERLQQCIDTNGGHLRDVIFKK